MSRKSQHFHFSQWLFTPSSKKRCSVFPLKKPEFSFPPLGLVTAFSAISRNGLCTSTLCFLPESYLYFVMQLSFSVLGKPKRLSWFKFLTVRYININPPEALRVAFLHSPFFSHSCGHQSSAQYISVNHINATYVSKISLVAKPALDTQATICRACSSVTVPSPLLRISFWLHSPCHRS